MSIKHFVKNLHTEDYYYLVFPDRHLCFELAGVRKALVYTNTFGGKLYSHFPHEEYGYYDPYNFSNDWTVYADDGKIIKYELDARNQVLERDL